MLTHFTDVHVSVTCKFSKTPEDKPFCSQTEENCIEFRLILCELSVFKTFLSYLFVLQEVSISPIVTFGW